MRCAKSMRARLPHGKLSALQHGRRHRRTESKRGAAFQGAPENSALM